MEKTYSSSELEALAKVLGDTEEGLTGSEIHTILASMEMTDPTPLETKWRRLFNAFADRQNRSQNRRAINEFIRRAMSPARYIQNPERFESRRTKVNRVLAFSGLALTSSGKLIPVSKANTLGEARKRAQELQSDLELRGVHPDVLRFCSAELVADNYFHAVLEATKSIATKIRSKTGLTSDGGELVDKALCGVSPLLAVNSLSSASEKSEQNGFANLVKGTFGMFRNTTAHEARILWNIDKEDAEDLLTLASLIHRRLDKARFSEGSRI